MVQSIQVYKLFFFGPSVVRELARFKDSLLFDEDDDSNTPLHLACANGHYGMAKVLLDAGSNPDAKYVYNQDCIILKITLSSSPLLL